MARTCGNVCKLCRREGMKLFLKGQRCFSEKCSINRRDRPPGMHSRPRKTTDYQAQLREKQKAKRIYGLLERQFQTFFQRAQRQKGNTGENLLCMLERRLDNVVLQLGLSFSRFHARQLVNHGHVLVNGKRCNIPSYLVRAGDEVSVSKAEHVRKISSAAVDINKGQGVPAWLEATPSDLKGKVIQLPKREDVPHPINEQLIIELCSK